MRWSVAPHRTAFLLVAVGLLAAVCAKVQHTSVTPNEFITRSYYERLRTLQTKAPSRLRQRSANPYGSDDFSLAGVKVKATSGQTFSEGDLKMEHQSHKKPTTTKNGLPARSQPKKKPDLGVVRAPPSTAPLTATPPTRETTMPPSTEPSPPATKLPPLRLTKQSNGTYTLEQMGKKKTAPKKVDYFGRPITAEKAMPTLRKKKPMSKLTAPTGAKTVEGTLPNAIVAFPKQQRLSSSPSTSPSSHGYDAAVEGLPATQPSGYDMGVEGGKEERMEKKITKPMMMTTTAETITKTPFSAEEDLYGASAGVNAAESKESGYAESQDAGVNSVNTEDVLPSTTPLPEFDDTTSSDLSEDTPASMDIRGTTEAPVEEEQSTESTVSSTLPTTLAARDGYDQGVDSKPAESRNEATSSVASYDAGIDSNVAEEREESSTTVVSAGYDLGVDSNTPDSRVESTTVVPSGYEDAAAEGTSNETEVETTTAEVPESTTTIFAAGNPYGGNAEENEVSSVDVETTTKGGYDDNVEKILGGHDTSTSIPIDNSTDVEVLIETTTKGVEATTDLLRNFEPKREGTNEVSGDIGVEATTRADGEEADMEEEDGDIANEVNETTLSPVNSTESDTSLDDAEVERAVERVLGEELKEKNLTMKGPTVTSPPVKVYDKNPTLVHNRLSIKPQETQRGMNATGNKGAETCPPPHRCLRNCFVFINDNGCQDCQCLWQSLPCESNEDCPEASQYCDAMKCQCRPGYKQNMRKSGSCEIDESFQGVRSIAPHIKPSEAIMKGKQGEQSAPGSYRRKRAAVVVKSFREERLQWPGI